MMRCVVIALLCAVAVGAQNNSPEPPKKGGISGIVVDKKTGDPVRKVVVMASIIRDGREDGAGTITDAEGKFTLTDLDPTTYYLSVDRSGYVQARDSQRKGVAVKAGETTPDVKIELLRTGAISGRVLDAEGDPVVGASVQVQSTRNANRGPAFWGATDDHGEYRVLNIAPGAYRLFVNYTLRPDIQVRMQKPAAPAGSFPALYFPGTLDAGHASVITVETGAELTGMDFRVIRAASVRVAGRVTRPADGSTPLFTFVELRPRGQNASQGPNTIVKGAKGEFELMNVLPGSYILMARSGGMDEMRMLTGRKSIDVGDSDLENIEVTLSPFRELTGRLIVPEGRKIPAGLMIALAPREEEHEFSTPGQPSGDGTFVVKKISPGDYDVMIGSMSTDAANDLYVSAIRMGDADVLMDGVHVGEPTPEPIEIVLKANGATADCIVKDDDGNAVAGAHVILQPDGPKKKVLALHGICNTDAQDRCKISGIAPGEYHGYAFAGETQGDIRDPDSFKPFEKLAKAVKLAEGDRQDIALKPASIE